VVYMALVPVVFGIVIASNSEPLFHLFGFLVCLGSTAARALKSVVQGLLLTSEAEKLHSMNFLMYMASFKEKSNRGTSGDREFLVNVQQSKGLPRFEGHLNHQSKEYD
jgi:hypothetical protein